MRLLATAIAILLAGVSACANPPASTTQALGLSMIPECRADGGGDQWPRSGNLRDDRTSPICTDAHADRMTLTLPLKLHPFKDGDATITFQCDSDRMAAFSSANANRWVVVTAGKSAVRRVWSLDRPKSEAGCAIAGMTTEEAINLCFDIAEELNEDPKQCATRCQAGKDGWACIASE